MRITLICRPFKFHGGVETSTAGLLGELAQRGHRVELITWAGQEPVPGVRLRIAHIPRAPSVLRLIAFAFAASRLARDGGADVVQSHERCVRQDVYRAGEGTHRGYLSAMGRPVPSLSPYHRVVLALESRIFRLEAAREVVANSRMIKLEIERLYRTPAQRVSVVHNGVDLHRFAPTLRERYHAPTRRALGIPGDAWCILFVGTGFERKGLGPLIEGVARLSAHDVWLVVAGKGSIDAYQATAERQGCASRVAWVGPRRDIECLYGAADVVALPSRYDPFPNVVLEALASGVPVLTSRHAGGAELISPGDNGWVVPDVTDVAIAQGLERLRSVRREHLTAAARRSAEPFTYGAQADALERLWRGLAR